MAKTGKKRIAATIIRETAPTTTFASPEKIQNDRAERAIKRTQEYESLSEQVAKSKIVYKNWYYPEGKTMFPYRYRMQFVDKYYPNADGGPLLVDEPQKDTEIDECLQKQKILKSLGYRYLVIDPQTNLYDALNQLGVV